MIKNLINNIKGCYAHVPYTWKHYWAFREVSKNLLGDVVHPYHDLRKLVAFIILPWLGEEKINNYHQKWNSHHPTYWENNEKIAKDPKKVDWMEAVIDWECARFTKPDKPLNARDTLYKFYPEYIQYVEPVLKDLGL